MALEQKVSIFCMLSIIRLKLVPAVVYIAAVSHVRPILFESVPQHESEYHTYLCAMSACEYLWCIIKTIVTEYDLSTIFKNFLSTLSTVFLSRIIGRIIMKSIFKINFSVKMSFFFICHSNRASALC